MKQSSKASFQMLFKVYCCANTCLHKNQTKVTGTSYKQKQAKLCMKMRTPAPHWSLVIENICNSFALHISTPKACSTLSLDFYSDHNKITKLQKDWNYPYSTLRVCLHCGQFSNLISIPKKDDPLKIVSTYIPCTISAKEVLEPPFESGSSKRNTTCLLLTKNTYKLLLFKLNYSPCQFCFVVETELFHHDIFRVRLHIPCAQINFSVKPTIVGGKVQWWGGIRAIKELQVSKKMLGRQFIRQFTSSWYSDTVFH